MCVCVCVCVSSSGRLLYIYIYIYISFQSKVYAAGHRYPVACVQEHSKIKYSENYKEMSLFVVRHTRRKVRIFTLKTQNYRLAQSISGTFLLIFL